MKPPNPDLMRGGGGNSPCLILWRGTCLGWPSPLNSNPGSTQILTRHYGAQSHTISQLESSGIMLTSKFPQPSPSGLLKHLRMGSVQRLHHILTTLTEQRGYIKVVSTTTHNTYAT
jgi:hypothetical protein